MRRGFPWLVGLIPMIAAAACGSADGTLDVSTALHRPGVTPADGATAYVIYQNSGTVTPIRTATNTALTRIKVGRLPFAIAITKPSASRSPGPGG
jgi:YVTN family beta-propeller protein